MKLLVRLLLILHIVVALPLLALYIGVYIDPSRCVWFVPLGYVFPLILLLNVLFVLVWALLKRKFLWFAIPLVIVGLAHINALIPIRNFFSASPECEGEFKIITYNVHLFGLYNWENNDKIKNEIFRFLESEKPDVACFQEYFYAPGSYFPTTDSLTRILGTKHYYQAFSATSAKRKQNFGIATFSKFPIVNKGTVEFKKTNNLFIFTDVILEGDTIRIYNCHLQSLYFDEENYADLQEFENDMMPESDMRPYKSIIKKVLKASRKRSEQAKILREHIDSCHYSIVVCGDFNDIPFSYSYRIISKGLRDSFSAQGRGFGNTWKYSGIKQRIDYVLFSKDLVCTGHDVCEQDYSDHYPVVVTLGRKK